MKLLALIAALGWLAALALLLRKVDAYLSGFDDGYAFGKPHWIAVGRKRGATEAQDALLVSR